MLPKRITSRTSNSKSSRLRRWFVTAARSTYFPLIIVFESRAIPLYHHSKDLLKVQRELGHKKIENTLFYVQTAESLYDDKPENYYVATTKTSKEFDELLAESWEYIGAVQFNNETLHKFRRPKLCAIIETSPISSITV